ncbi:MAG: alcohol dehydrogenase family protein [Anaerolineae bacterium]|nr:alcohol dehydrogenase family protein [Anaerolineae bacterium]
MTNIPEKMTAAILTGHGGFDKLEYRTDWPTPTPQPGEILIRVAACGINNTDINTRTAWYSPSVTSGTNAGGGAGFAEVDDAGDWGGTGLTFPRIQGADIVGRVVAVGDGVSDEWLGARVMVDPWLRDWSNPMDRYQAGFTGSECDGGFAQYVARPERHVHRVTSPWSDEELATFACAYITAENMLSRSRVSRGETVLITGASGGVGSALVQLAKRRGATVLAMAGVSKMAQVKSIGADAVFPRDVEDLPAAIVEATGAPQVDVVADVVAGPIFKTLLAVLHRGGRYVTAGAIAGPIVELDVRTLYLKDLELIGATVPTPDIFPALLRYIEAQEIRPLLAKAYPLAEITQAQQDFLDKTFVGKLVLVPPGEG